MNLTRVTDDEDVALLAAVASGDVTAFDVLFARHAPAVVSLASARLRDSARAHDVTQEVFLRLYRSLHQFRGDAALRTWLVRVTLNCCTDLERRHARHTNHEVVGYAETLAVAGAQESEAVRQDEAHRLRLAIATLPEELRVLIALRYDAELPYAEIATIVGLPLGTVATRLTRALRLLHDALGSRT